MDIYLTEMTNVEIKKVIISKDFEKIVGMYKKASDGDKEKILNGLDDKTFKRIEKMIDGGLL